MDYKKLVLDKIRRDFEEDIRTLDSIGSDFEEDRDKLLKAIERVDNYEVGDAEEYFGLHTYTSYIRTWADILFWHEFNERASFNEIEDFISKLEHKQFNYCTNKLAKSQDKIVYENDYGFIEK